MTPRHRTPRNPLHIAAAGIAVAMALTATIGTIVTVIDAGAMPGPASAHTSTDDAGPASRAPERR